MTEEYRVIKAPKELPSAWVEENADSAKRKFPRLMQRPVLTTMGLVEFPNEGFTASLNPIKTVRFHDSSFFNFPLADPSSDATFDITDVERHKNFRFYLHPETGKEVCFVVPTSRESLVCYRNATLGEVKPEFDLARKILLNDDSLIAPKVRFIDDGVYVNPPRDENGNILPPHMKEKDLRGLLTDQMKCGDIWLYRGDNPRLRHFGFAPYGTFKEGPQSVDDFARSGLARVLAHTPEDVAEIFREIAPEKSYPNGVNIAVSSKPGSAKIRTIVIGNKDTQHMRDYYGRGNFKILEVAELAMGYCYAFGIAEPKVK